MEKETTEVVETQTRAPIKASLISKGGLIPTNFEELYRLSHVMAASGMMPKGIETAAKVFVAVQNGLEVGLSPMQAVQNTAVINGRATIYGDAALGLIRASGLLEKFKEWFEGQGDDLTAHCHVKRKGEADPAIGTFSVADAKLAKLYPGDALSPWAKYPKRMLQWRARSWPLRDKFADVLRGLRITEEAIDLKEVENGSFEMGKEERLPEDFSSIAVPDEKGGIDPDAHEDFDKKVPKEAKAERVKEFLGLVQQSAEKTTFEIKQEAFDHWDEFWASFLKWEGKNYGEDKPGPSDNEDKVRMTMEPEDLALYDELKNVRSAGLETKVIQAEARILECSPKFQDWLKFTKWANVYKGSKTYPFIKKETGATGEIATPGEDSEDNVGTSQPGAEEGIVESEEGWIDCSHADIVADRIKVTYCEGGCRFQEGCKDYEAHLNKKD